MSMPPKAKNTTSSVPNNVKKMKMKYIFSVITILGLAGFSGYAETILYQETFSGSSNEYIRGKSPDISVGSATWSALTNSGPWMADGSTAGDTSLIRGALLPFSPETGNVYTLTMDMNPTSGTRWFELGFTSASRTDLSFTTATVGASAWFYLKTDRTTAGTVAGGTFTSVISGQQTFYGSDDLAGTVSVKIVLDTTETLWSAEWFVNGSSVRTNTYTENPEINYVGFTRHSSDTAGVIDNFQLVQGEDSVVEELPLYHLSKPSSDEVLPWDMDELSQTPVTYAAPDFEAEAADGITPLFFEGEVYTGMTTRVFAWVGIPTNGVGPFPAMVLVHGAGGTAYQDWVQLWMDQGYAAIAMDTAGQIPEHPDGATTGWVRHDYAGPEGWGGFDQIDEAITDQWMYHAVAAVVRGHSLLRSYAQVDTNRIGITGISWGGILTCNTAGLDSRFAFAAPVYGCGFLGEDSYWLSSVMRPMGETNSLIWLNNWDPGRHVGRATMPMLFVDGSNDKHFRLGSWQKTYRQPETDVSLSCQVRLSHSDYVGRVPEVTAYANSKFFGGEPLAEVIDAGRTNQDVWAMYSAESTVSNAVLNYTVDSGAWTGRYWETTSADLNPTSRVVTAVLPTNTTAYYFNLYNPDGMISSSEHEELTGYEQVDDTPSNVQLSFENGSVDIGFDLAVTANYRIEASTNLTAGSGWTDLSGLVPNYWDDPVDVSVSDLESSSQQYYRVGIE
jgi:dienelactone hydrolase